MAASGGAEGAAERGRSTAKSGPAPSYLLTPPLSLSIFTNVSSGFIPDYGVPRNGVFVLMILLATFQMVSKVFSTALLLIVNPLILAGWVAVELAILFAYKILRRDFFYFVPWKGAFKYIGSLFERAFVLVLVNFTGLILFANPYELGGLYFSANVVLSQVGCWIVAYFYVTMLPDSPTKIPSDKIVLVLSALLCSWSVTTLIFFRLINRSYWQIFYSTVTGSAFAKSYFVDGRDEATKAMIFTNSIELWRDIEDDVEAYVRCNWERWEADKPEWFNENFKSTVPDWMIPAANLEAMNRRASLLGGLGRRKSIAAQQSRDHRRASAT